MLMPTCETIHEQVSDETKTQKYQLQCHGRGGSRRWCERKHINVFANFGCSKIFLETFQCLQHLKMPSDPKNDGHTPQGLVFTAHYPLQRRSFDVVGT
jgi:hypothetical protein